MNSTRRMLLDLAQKIARDKASQDSVPLNVIEELHANENAHSRILRQILQMRRNGRYIFLDSFLRSFGIEVEPKNPVIVCERNRIDLLIKEDGRYAVVVENKVCDAVDQTRQIDRYFNLSEKFAGAQNTWVVYLTRDGSKTVSSESLSEATGKKLADRFLQRNFRDDVLPWLEGYVFPGLGSDDSLLAANICVYIDFLKGMLNLKPINVSTKMNDEIRDLIKKEIFKDGDGFADALNNADHIYKAITDIQTAIGEQLDALVAELIGSNIVSPIKGSIGDCEITCLELCNAYNFIFRVSTPALDEMGITIGVENENSGIAIGIFYSNKEKAAPHIEVTKERIRSWSAGEMHGTVKENASWPIWIYTKEWGVVQELYKNSDSMQELAEKVVELYRVIINRQTDSHGGEG